MTTEFKMDLYGQMIEKLDKDHETALSNQQVPTGNNLEIRNQIGTNMVFQRKYEDERKKLVSLLKDATPVSQSVQDYIVQKHKIANYGKLDVISGATTVDRSLETEGKALGKQI